MAAYSHQSVDGDKVPVVQIFLFFNLILYQLQLLGWIIDESTQVLLLTGAKRVIEDCAHLTLNPTAGIAQHMLESQVLTVQVGQEVFSSFGEVEDSLEIDNLGASGCYIRETARQQFQKIKVAFSFFGFHRYCYSFKFKVYKIITMIVNKYYLRIDILTFLPLTLAAWSRFKASVASWRGTAASA